MPGDSGDFMTATEYKEVFFIKMSKDSFLLGAFSGTCILLLHQKYKLALYTPTPSALNLSL